MLRAPYVARYSFPAHNKNTFFGSLNNTPVPHSGQVFHIFYILAHGYKQSFFHIRCRFLFHLLFHKNSRFLDKGDSDTTAISIKQAHIFFWSFHLFVFSEFSICFLRLLHITYCISWIRSARLVYRFCTFALQIIS